MFEIQTYVPVIGQEQVALAWQVLQKYKAGKANLEKRIIENEQWFKLRHWECMRRGKPGQVEPASGWLFNCIAGKHADAMDNFPAPTVLPREQSDIPEARMLSAVLPVILEQNDFESVYHRVWDDKLKSGTGVYGVFWDENAQEGLGDVVITKVNLLNLFWEPGITDIQRSRNLFHVELRDKDLLLEHYPQLEGKLGGECVDLSRYVYDDSVDTTEKSAVIDWYYKKGGRLHYCKFVGDTVLFATENEPAFAQRGWYDHGLYPFVFDALYQVEGTPCGFGYIDVGKSAQEYIDRGNQAILQNMLWGARPRHFIRADGEVNEEEYADLSRDFVHVGGTLGQDSILPIQGKPLNSLYLQVVNNKIDELKETTGNRDISTGGTASGVTAASAIAAMQEAGSKLSRDNNKASYRAFRRVISLTIELLRQFYSLPRCFRILGPDGSEQYIRYGNAGLQSQPYHKPVFDITVTAQKQSPYSKLSQNEMALQFFGAGFFDARLADQALACLDMMDFERKDFVIRRIAQNARFALPTAAVPGRAEMPAEAKESPVTQRARERVAEAANPG